MTRLLLIVTLLPIALASYCGKSGVPYSFEVLESGAPVLGCAQPSCVISSEDFEEDSEFLTDANGQADGYFREGDRALKRYRNDNAPKLVANCSGGFSQLSCPRKNQWVGGIEYIDHPRQPLILQCCSFDGLRFSQEVGMTVVNSGEAVTGGEVIRNGRQISFDVIANVRKIVQSVTVRRMNCLPDPPEPQVEFDKDVPSEVLKVLSTAKNGKDLGTKEKFEKMSHQKPNKKQQKKQKKNQEASAFGAKQYAADSQNSISVDFASGSSNNLEPLATAAPQPPRQRQQPQPLPQAPQQPQQQQYVPPQQPQQFV
uniref:Uncharacterized protein n=1 Tax=Panagrolaimus sp. PS1159 TaxID=55785 RepID=A0AC35FRW5_9BILA